VSQQKVAERLEVTQDAVSQWVARAREDGDEALKTRPPFGAIIASIA
jgi:putative transposase